MRKQVRIGVATGILAATSLALVAGAPTGAQAATGNTYYADAQAQYVTVEGSVGGAFLGNLFSGKLQLGPLEATVNSQGLTDLNGEAAPAGAKSGARGDLAIPGLAGFQLSLDHVQSTAPAASGPATKTYLALPASPIVDAGLIHGDSSAIWGNAVFGAAAPSKVISTANGDTSYVDLLDLSKLAGSAAALLPAQLRHPLVQLETIRVHTQTGSLHNSDGTHGLTAGGVGGLASLQILGGAANGGLTVGLFNHDTGAAKDTAGTRVWATGKPGGAGCSYTIPDSIKIAVGTSTVSLPISAANRFPIPGGLGYLDAEFVGMASCQKAADGTSATATGAGLGVHLHLTVPGTGAELADFMVSIPGDLKVATVKVPAGGIKPTDGNGGTGGSGSGGTGGTGGNGSGGSDGSGNGGTAGGGSGSTVDPPHTSAHGTSTVAAVSDAGSGVLPNTGGVPRWMLLLGAGLLLAGGRLVAAHRSWQRNTA